MFGRKSSKCPDCDEGFLKGNGKCSQCFGTGVNVSLVSENPKCDRCGGTGTCSRCGGTGVVANPKAG
jgi:hypothetical protein